MKSGIVILFILIFSNNGVHSQVSNQLGYIKTCDTDFPSKNYRGGNYIQTIEHSKKKSVYIYNYNKYYTVSEDNDTNVTNVSADQKITYTFHKKDTALVVRIEQNTLKINEKYITEKTYRYDGKVNDILTSQPLLKFIYDDELYPDDELIIYLDPDYGIVKMRNRVWFWVSYFYNSKDKTVTDCDCSKVLHDSKK